MPCLISRHSLLQSHHTCFIANVSLSREALIVSADTTPDDKSEAQPPPYTEFCVPGDKENSNRRYRGHTLDELQQSKDATVIDAKDVFVQVLQSNTVLNQRSIESVRDQRCSMVLFVANQMPLFIPPRQGPSDCPQTRCQTRIPIVSILSAAAEDSST